LVFVVAMLVAVFAAAGCSSTGALAIVGNVAPDGTVGVPYNSTLAVTGGTGIYTWTVANLPPGVTASGTSSSTLVLSGKPTTAADYTISATVTDTKLRTDTYTSGIDISTSPVLTINGTLPFTGSVGAAYSGTLTATGGTAPYTWTIENLPPGLTAAGESTSTLAVTGPPTKAGTFIVAITLTDSLGATAKSSIPVTISSAAGLAITGSLPATGTVGAAYSGSLMATGGTGPYTWLLSNLPQGVGDSGLDTDTVTVSGSPMSDGTYNATALVTDSKNNTALYSVTVVIGAGQSAADSACTTMPSPLGNESQLMQAFAFVMNRTDANALPVSWAGSFTPDGKGKIAAADVDEISLAGGPASYRVNLEGSSYSYGSDGNGCLYLAFDGVNDAGTAAPGSHEPNLELGGNVKSAIPSNAAAAVIVPASLSVHFTVSSTYRAGTIAVTSGTRQVLEWGHIYAQTPTEFAPAKLAPQFAFGATGAYIAPADEIEHASMAGSIAFIAETGALVNGSADNNIGGDISGELSGARGTLTPSSIATGRGTGSYTVDTPRGEISFDFAYYAIDADDFIFISSDSAEPGNFLLTGRALAAATPAPSLSGRYHLEMLGVYVNGNAGHSRTTLDETGRLEIEDDGSTHFSWVKDGWGKSPVLAYPNAIARTDFLTGRTTFQSPGAALPVAYLTRSTSKESIAGFLVGTDDSAASGTLHLALTPFKP